MERFCRLKRELESAVTDERRCAVLQAYLEEVPEADASWAIFLLSTRRIPKILTELELKSEAIAHCGFPEWLIDQCAGETGDLAEALALLCGRREYSGGRSQTEPARGLSEWMESREKARKSSRLACELAREMWSELSCEASFYLQQIFLGKWRPGLEEGLLEEALSRVTGLSRSLIARRLAKPEPTLEFYRQLTLRSREVTETWEAYPFSPRQEADEAELRERFTPQGGLFDSGMEWEGGWVRGGERLQLVRRAQGAAIWSEASGWITERVPRLRDAALTLALDSVIEGALLPEGRFEARDCLEARGSDIRGLASSRRRQALEELLSGASSLLVLAQRFQLGTWEELEALHSQCRTQGSEGLWLSPLESPYGELERVRAAAPLSIDAVLLYANSAQGEYTFAVWNGTLLVPVGRASSCLEDKEEEELDRWVRKNTREKFGPVRSVDPIHVFEIAFDAIEKSPRHKAGVVLRSPRMLRWKRGLEVSKIASLEGLHRLVPSPQS